MSLELPKQYEPAAIEQRIYARWLDAKAFAAFPDDNPRRYVIMMPLPNITAALHMGHAMDNVMQVLTDAGVAEEDIQTTGITVQPIYDFNQPTPVIESYTASNTVDVKIRDLESVGEIVDGVTNAAGNAVRINYITFEREDMGEEVRRIAGRLLAD